MRKDKLLSQFRDAYTRLQEAMQEPLSNPLAVDGTIKRFEFCFELSWKSIKAFLEEEGMACNSPKGCLKEAYQFGLIENEEGWLSLLRARNLTAHVYNEKMAMEVYEEVRRHHGEIRALLNRLEEAGEPLH